MSTERVPLSPDADAQQEGPGSHGPASSTCASVRGDGKSAGGGAADAQAGPGTAGHDYLAELRGEAVGDLGLLQGIDKGDGSGMAAPDEFLASPPVRRFRIGDNTPTSACDMQFVAKVCGGRGWGRCKGLGVRARLREMRQGRS